MPMPANECEYPLYGALEAVIASSCTSYGMLSPCRAVPVVLVSELLNVFTDAISCFNNCCCSGGMFDELMSPSIASIVPLPRALNISWLTASMRSEEHTSELQSLRHL